MGTIAIFNLIVGAVSPAGSASVDLGNYYYLVIVLCTINTVSCLYFVWRIFKDK